MDENERSDIEQVASTHTIKDNFHDIPNLAETVSTSDNMNDVSHSLDEIELQLRLEESKLQTYDDPETTDRSQEEDMCEHTKSLVLSRPGDVLEVDDEFHDAEENIASPLRFSPDKPEYLSEAQSAHDKQPLPLSQQQDQDHNPSQSSAESVWVNENKHVIILSDAGKPIYTRHGGEDMIVTRTGVIQALISFIEENFCKPDGTHGCITPQNRQTISRNERDELRWFKSGKFRYVFLVRTPIYLVLISKTDEPILHLQKQLRYVYNQLLSITTLTHIERTFKRWSNYDLRRHLAGMEKFTEHLVDQLQIDYSYFLDAFECSMMEPALRIKVGSVLQSHRCTDAVFALMFNYGKLITLMRLKRFTLHPQASLKIAGLRHFIYKLSKLNQFVSPDLEPPYSSPEESCRLFSLYQRLDSHVHSKHRPVKLLFRSCLQESLLAWVTSSFELYVVFDPLATKEKITDGILELLRWLKRSESRLFMISSQFGAILMWSRNLFWALAIYTCTSSAEE
eukprot:gene7329-7679_t